MRLLHCSICHRGFSILDWLNCPWNGAIKQWRLPQSVTLCFDGSACDLGIIAFRSVRSIHAYPIMSNLHFASRCSTDILLLWKLMSILQKLKNCAFINETTAKIIHNFSTWVANASTFDKIPRLFPNVPVSWQLNAEKNVETKSKTECYSCSIIVASTFQNNFKQIQSSMLREV